MFDPQTANASVLAFMDSIFAVFRPCCGFCSAFWRQKVEGKVFNKKQRKVM